ncbi:NAD-dependent succinate-semialdehyde dehydrogenase [Ekhidna sp.]|jgi:succinate-semialdehyde dehydrogenase/glutarate-semialdehyde dehydrogenase|uniref:NAD-dependent succinate-semialdehyde dehydrogenase n=1 Tax=Ekhidna sp. TaxID=2608089 RepID=UPI0032EFA20D
MQAINPATEQPLKDYPNHTDRHVIETIEASQSAFREWKNTSFVYRANLMKKAADVLRTEQKALARLMTVEMGKTLKESEAEVEKCAWVCEFYADKASEFLKDEIIETNASKSYVSHRPLGIVFAVMPWNYPFWQVFRFAAPSIMAGNVAILKHAPNVPGCAEAIVSVFEKAGFPKGVFSNLYISNEQASNVIEHPHVKAITLTGSTRAGKEVAKQAGAALKKCVLELGGSDPYIILEDADLDLAIKTTVASRLKNNGQSCISAKRFIVPESIKEEVEKRLIEEMESYTFGDPTDEETDLGPLVGEKYRNQLHDQVKRSIEAGAKCILGGEIPDMKGYYYPPTILTDVKKGTPAYEEELFGPVATVIAVKDEKEALEVANDTYYGLGGAIFSRDVAKAERLAAEKLEAGSCFVNEMVSSDPRLPFGGINESGFGRELSHHGIKEFVNVKTVFIK